MEIIWGLSEIQPTRIHLWQYHSALVFKRTCVTVCLLPVMVLKLDDDLLDIRAPDLGGTFGQEAQITA